MVHFFFYQEHVYNPLFYKPLNTNIMVINDSQVATLDKEMYLV